MKLEFELRKVDVDEEDVIYDVMFQGINVGTLILDKDPYNKEEAFVNYMEASEK